MRVCVVTKMCFEGDVKKPEVSHQRAFWHETASVCLPFEATGGAGVTGAIKKESSRNA